MHVIRSASAAGLAIATLLVSSAASADPDEVVTGEVVSSRSRWARGKTEIVTESVIRASDGREVTVRQRGGSVDGIGMIVLHTDPVLRPGDRVEAKVALARDGRGRISRPVLGLYQIGHGTGGGPIPFVRSEATRTRAQLYWESGCAQLFFDEAGTSEVAGDGEFDEMKAVLAEWRRDTESCTYFEVRFEGFKDAEVGLDGVNLVKFRDERWCRPATDDDPEECYNRSAAGLTTLHFIDDADSDRNGALLDADVEMNGVDFNIAVDGESEGQMACDSDLANTFTHEIGHLMGLDHTCWSGSGEPLLDDEGNPAPDCFDGLLAPEIREATMFALQDCGETKKDSPEQDDIDGVCAIYPLADDPEECSGADLGSGGCAVAAGGAPGDPGSGSAGALILAGLALLFARRRA